LNAPEKGDEIERTWELRACGVLVGNPERQRKLRRTIRRWEYIIKMALRETR
jgi:hypothetical protein